MGTFALCWESAARDIRSLLTLHRVHPQVRTDIQRILGSLLRKTYENMAVSVSKDLTESSEQVCRALVDNIMDEAFKTALPASDMRALKLRCIELEEENANLRASAKEDASHLAEVRGVLLDLKKAHDYMLHSYFREVLILRYRTDELNRQLRTRRVYTASPTLHATGNTVSPPQTMESQLQQFGSRAAPTRGQCGSLSGPSTSAPSLSLLSGSPDASTKTGDNYVQLQHSANPNPSEKRFDADADFRTSAAVPCEAADGAALASLEDAKRSVSSRMQGRKNRDAGSAFHGRTASRAPTATPSHSMMGPTNVTLDVPETTEPDSVDAIFDYEEYIRILNGGGGENVAWENRFAHALSLSRRESAASHGRSSYLRLRIPSEAYLPNKSGSGDMIALLDGSSAAGTPGHETVNSDGFRLLLSLALEPVQHDFHIQLGELREAVKTMQQNHQDDMQLIQRALFVVQNCNDALLDFLNTFVQETRHIVSVMTQDVQAQNIMELLSTGAPPDPAAEAVKSFFTLAESAISSAGPQSLSPPPLLPLSGDEDSWESAKPNLSSRKRWRLKPDVALRAQARPSDEVAMNGHLGRPNPVGTAARMPCAPTKAAEEVYYYRADLALPYWKLHPVISHAQVIFGELQEAAATVRAARAKQLLESEGAAVQEELSAQGSGQGTTTQSEHSRDHRGSRCLYSLSEGQGDPSLRRFPIASVVGEILSDNRTVDPRLREEWRTSVVRGADGLTAADLLRELVGARMRRACDQKRLKRIRESLLEECEGDAARSESLLRSSTLETLQTRVQRRLTRTSQRISEIQRLLDSHLSEFKLWGTESSPTPQVAQSIATGESPELLSANDPMNTVDHRWSSPYLNDITLDGSSRFPWKGGDAYSRHGRRGVLYLPVGLVGEQGADGKTFGGAGAFVVLDGSTVSAAPFAQSLTAASQSGEGRYEDTGPSTTARHATPFAAVMDYCRGVQLGRPLGRRAGPVYVFQDDESGGYYVGDETGRRVVKGSDEAAGDAEENTPSEADVRRSLLPMTRILFPAPAGFSAATAEADPSFAAPPMTASVEPDAGLNPIYLVPMAIPMESEDAVVREGWQACHRHGHTRLDPIYYPTLVPLPLSTSFRHVVPQPGNAEDVARAKAAASMGLVAYDGGSNASRNRYFHSPPRVFQPADEAVEMIRIRSVQLQKTRGRNDAVLDTAAAAADSGVTCASFGVHSPSMAAHSIGTVTTALPSTVGPFSGCSPSSHEPHPLSMPSVPTADSQDTQGRAVAAPPPGDPKGPSTQPLALSSSSVPDTALATTANDSASPPPKAVPFAAFSSNTDAAFPAPAAASVLPSSHVAHPLAAALVVAKEKQRSRRLAEEAARAAQATTFRPDSLRNQTLITTVPSAEGDVQRVAPHRLAPLSGRHPGGGAPLVLPPPAESARLQRKMRADKHLRTVPLPPTRWREANRGSGGNPWNLKSDGCDAD
ncbi:hypothetical protein JKF63_02247 [Porcisia hertigi]|uniref:Uncharacterized protein n=1 Tax=Porcisia hertigi TaxID=2761500 RepID=A0A836H7P6_9TRYP|nr:hypothetical protein JKF63_02247 [Porcisia hertigi]